MDDDRSFGSDEGDRGRESGRDQTYLDYIRSQGRGSDVGSGSSSTQNQTWLEYARSQARMASRSSLNSRGRRSSDGGESYQWDLSAQRRTSNQSSMQSSIQSSSLPSVRRKFSNRKIYDEGGENVTSLPPGRGAIGAPSRVYVTDEEDNRFCTARQRKWTLISVLLLLAVAGVASGLALVFRTNENDVKPLEKERVTGDANQGDDVELETIDGTREPGTPIEEIAEEKQDLTMTPSFFPTGSPSYIPSSSPTTQTYMAMYERLVGVVTKAEDLAPDSNSPQHRALEYLSSNDPTKPSPDDNSFLPRYVLSVLYFATGGEGWTSRVNWLVEKDLCTWDGLYCKLHVHGETGERVVTAIKRTQSNLVGTLPSEIGFLENLEELAVQNNDISGEIPESIGHLTKLTNISLSRNMMTGEIPASIGKLTNLQAFMCNENQFNGTLPTEIGLLGALDQLLLYGNDLGGPLPTELGLLTKLQRLWASNNEFTEMLPEEIGNMVNLKALYLDENNLFGKIPPSLGNATFLEDMRLYSNSFTGEIPSGLSTLQKVKILFLDQNSFNGVIPKWFGMLQELKYLDLSNNRFSGPVPPELGNIPSLVRLRLDQNRLTGRIPTSFETLLNLDTLKLEINKIEGNVSEGMCAIGISELSVDCEVTCTCCSSCMRKVKKQKQKSSVLGSDSVTTVLFILFGLGILGTIIGTISLLEW